MPTWPSSSPRTRSHPSRVCGLKSINNAVVIAGLYVTPFTGVWIEIPLGRNPEVASQSHPSRVCGLKSSELQYEIQVAAVTPFTGVWIEIDSDTGRISSRRVVTPFTGVWIEINTVCSKLKPCSPSHPSRVCGLKWIAGDAWGRGAVASHPSRVCGLKFSTP